MYVSVLLKSATPDTRNLNPLDRKSTPACTFSALDRFVSNWSSTRLYVLRSASNIVQLPVLSACFINTHFGLNPVYTNVPSVELLPSYDPTLLKPSTLWKQYAMWSPEPPVKLLLRVSNVSE